jgi:NAD(P)-dependent dehydrogenase (short-subunit alcohol dehydrogenase family)
LPSDASIAAAAATILGEAGTIDVLVNNAGTGHFAIAEAFTPSAVEAQFATNVVGRFVVRFGGVYTASKWALEALAETSSYELAPAGQRPLRTPVPGNPAVKAINPATAPIQRGVLEGFALGALLPKTLA